MKGFIDLLFEWEGRLYVLDWKTDSLEEYSEPHLRSIIESRYALQAKIYGAAVVRQERMDEATYESRFGGLLYAFLRGFSDDSPAMVHLRPSLESTAPSSLQPDKSLSFDCPKGQGLSAFGRLPVQIIDHIQISLLFSYLT